jgi:hypothetical protein
MALSDEVEKMRYKVMRNDKPVTNEELTLEEAQQELNRWQNILKRWPDGTRVRLEPVIK